MRRRRLEWRRLEWRRLWALIQRHLFVWRRNIASLLDLFYWPLVDLLVLGFLATYLVRQGLPFIVGFLLGGVILWDIFFRVQQGISVSFMMEMWSRNLLNLFVSPLSVREFLVAMMLYGMIKITVTATLMITLAWVLYQFNIFAAGPALVPFAVGLIVFGWAVGTVVTGLLLRFGLAAETVAWSLAFLFQPFAAVYFPVSVYPEWLRKILWFLPLPHVFEGLRHALAGRGLHLTHLAWLAALDVIALALAFAFFEWMFREAMRRGSLLKATD
jgi:ABC-2 type transport system permease protein